MSGAMEVPFVEQLRGVDKGFRASYAFQWSEDGTETGHHCVPVGYMMHKAADHIDAQDKRIAELKNHREGLFQSNARQAKTIANLEQEVARLSDHIRAIADHHENRRNHYGKEWFIKYHTERRDFAIAALTSQTVKVPVVDGNWGITITSNAGGGGKD